MADMISSFNDNMPKTSNKTQRPVIEWFKQQERSAMFQTMPIDISDRFQDWKIRVLVNRFVHLLLMLIATSALYVILIVSKVPSINGLLIIFGFSVAYSMISIEHVFLITRLNDSIEKKAVK